MPKRAKATSSPIGPTSPIAGLRQLTFISLHLTRGSRAFSLHFRVFPRPRGEISMRLPATSLPGRLRTRELTCCPLIPASAPDQAYEPDSRCGQSCSPRGLSRGRLLVCYEPIGGRKIRRVAPTPCGRNPNCACLKNDVAPVALTRSPRAIGGLALFKIGISRLASPTCRTMIVQSLNIRITAR